MLQNNSNDSYNICLIARGNHLEEIKKNGLKLISEDETIITHPYIATKNILEVPKPDLILLCVKSYDLATAIKDITMIMTDKTVILPLLNGIDIPERIRKYTDKGYILPACVYVGTHLEEAGVIKQKGGTGNIIFGDDKNKGPSASLETSKVLNELGIYHDYFPVPDKQIWTKYLFIAAYGIVTSATGKTLGEVYENNKLKNNVEEIMKEIVLLASKKGIELDENTISCSLDKANTFPFEAKTSFQRDFENPLKKNEKELFVDTLLMISEDSGVEVPMIKKYNKLLQEKTLLK
jgi:2-dehydropantoate 2-reductase